MAIASKLQEYMSEHGLRYDVLTHPHSHNSMETAQLARVPGNCLAKSVVLEDDDGFLMAVLPSTQHVQLGWLSKAMQSNLRLASEDELSALFADCEPGAVPPAGIAYGMRMVVDDTLAEQPEIYFEGGDHEKLIQMSCEDFMRMMEEAKHIRFGEHYWRH
ncbi:aminoacyl-tRNA deacylase [Aromatoleum aromaticum]|uniref:aminoacyl-tRNA deacylase n=1 Tax=Aromatoleum aromaticum TaxID=551760 RepID=UPI001459ECB8|nr:YbaK/EbsC family protein [Aromatoleum aromaticum]NMG53384.1 aminoacyl-tRNA deacylase [Aromatoleum aromaticum]